MEYLQKYLTFSRLSICAMQLNSQKIYKKEFPARRSPSPISPLSLSLSLSFSYCSSNSLSTIPANMDLHGLKAQHNNLIQSMFYEVIAYICFSLPPTAYILFGFFIFGQLWLSYSLSNFSFWLILNFHLLTGKY
jgi:hypothetical protein